MKVRDVAALVASALWSKPVCDGVLLRLLLTRPLFPQATCLKHTLHKGKEEEESGDPERPYGSGRGADLDRDTQPPSSTTTTLSCSKHGCSHQRQPCISEEMLKTLQQLASGLIMEARTSPLLPTPPSPTAPRQPGKPGNPGPTPSAVSWLQDGAGQQASHSTQLI
ncbi:hypothetical protein FQN60_000162 [Etheostoma spectabile]|uniref:Uncharacterized protein n=1 Tax=Etheostoma spectabile TaxID=54343 RepID=A0A5J5D0Q2_9PERO|nr:hypothetical protein FQN60_000162 [Etheostoma spectabile]